VRQRIYAEHPDLAPKPLWTPPEPPRFEFDEVSARKRLAGCIEAMREQQGQLQLLCEPSRVCGAAQLRLDQAQAALAQIEREEGAAWEEWTRDPSQPQPQSRTHERAQLRIEVSVAKDDLVQAQAVADRAQPSYASAVAELNRLSAARDAARDAVLLALLHDLAGQYREQRLAFQYLGGLLQQLRSQLGNGSPAVVAALEMPAEHQAELDKTDRRARTAVRSLSRARLSHADAKLDKPANE
jgi:hypothetical protein